MESGGDSIRLGTEERLADSHVYIRYAAGTRSTGRRASAEVEDDRRDLNDAGLDVAGLESKGRLVIEALDLDEPPDALPGRLEAGLDAALDRGLTGL